MTTITTQLADALRAVSGAPGNPCNCLDGDIHGDCDHCKAREALAAYDAQQAQSAPAGDHAAEPWSDTPHGHIIDATGRTVSTTVFRTDDRRRIVACVNACAGIPTASLESGELRNPHESITLLFGAYARGGLSGHTEWEEVDEAFRRAAEAYPEAWAAAESTAELDD